jgi:hypothetical protein
MSQTRLMLLLMMWRVAMVSSRVTPRLGRTRGMSGLSQCGCIEMMSTVRIEARRRRFAPPLAAIAELFTGL